MIHHPWLSEPLSIICGVIFIGSCSQTNRNIPHLGTCSYYSLNILLVLMHWLCLLVKYLEQLYSSINTYSKFLCGRRSYVYTEQLIGLIDGMNIWPILHFFITLPHLPLFPLLWLGMLLLVSHFHQDLTDWPCSGQIGIFGKFLLWSISNCISHSSQIQSKGISFVILVYRWNGMTTETKINFILCSMKIHTFSCIYYSSLIFYVSPATTSIR